MSPRAVLSFNMLTDVGHILRIEEVIVPLEAGDLDQARCDFSQLNGALSNFELEAPPLKAVGDIGNALFCILKKHPPVERQLAASNQPEYSVLIDDMSPEPQSLPWEALNIGGRFLALDNSPLLGRTVTSREAPKPMLRIWDDRLRIVAVLAATGVKPDGIARTAAEELIALVKGLGANGAPPFHLIVLGCDFNLPGVAAADDVREVVRQLSPALEAENSRIEFRELEGQHTLAEALTGLRPHIVHFFCHGQVEDAMAPRLELALRPDQVAQRSRGSLVLEADELIDLVSDNQAIWLVVLNCCDGAAATESVSLARDVIQRAGRSLPAVVAMREAIDRRDAHTFTTEFYRQAATLIGRKLKSDAAIADVQWLEALPAVRQAMCKARCKALSKAADCREWTVPVMYVRREALQICLRPEPAVGVPPAPAPLSPAAPAPAGSERLSELQAELSTLKSLHDDLSPLPTTPPEMLKLLDQRIQLVSNQLLALLLKDGREAPR